MWWFWPTVGFLDFLTVVAYLSVIYWGVEKPYRQARKALEEWGGQK